MVFVLTLVVLQSISFSNYALTTKTTNIIHGSAPYLTFDGGLTRVTNTEALLRISLSDGRTFTPKTTNSSDNPIILPVAGQSFADIGMLMPTDTDSIALSSLIGTPYNYWGDDDGDGEGVNGITATGRLRLSIIDKNYDSVARNEELDICNAPYKLTLSNSEGTLTTRYGIPNESRFEPRTATYYINPKAAPVICYVKPNLFWGYGFYAGPANIWTEYKGFIPQSFTPSSYGLNFPTTGAHNLYFDLEIGGNNQDLSWAPVSHGGIKATMTSPTKTRVRVTLTGPAVTDSKQQSSDNPDEIDRPSLPQTFELVGRDSSGNAVVKYGFVLKQWFVSRGTSKYKYSSVSSWCTKIGDYRVPAVKDLTNATCNDAVHYCRGAVGATPSSSGNGYQRQIGAGFFTEWGSMRNHYSDAFFRSIYFWTSDATGNTQFSVNGEHGEIMRASEMLSSNADAGLDGVCVYP